MTHEKDVRQPWEFGRVLRAADEELAVGQSPRGREEERLERLLAIGGVRSEIREIAPVSFLRRHGMVHGRIDAAVQRRGPLRAKDVA